MSVKCHRFYSSIIASRSLREHGQSFFHPLSFFNLTFDYDKKLRSRQDKQLARKQEELKRCTAELSIIIHQESENVHHETKI